MGLAIVGAIAAAYQGIMEVDSGIAKGSTFTLISPQHPPGCIGEQTRMRVFRRGPWRSGGSNDYSSD